VQDVAYLGPAGTFSQDAAIALFGGNERLLAMPTIPLVLESVRNGKAAFGVVPIENSIHGEVTMTMDALVFDFVDLFVGREIVVPVSFSAFRKFGDDGPVRRILSHPHALAQCRRFVETCGGIVTAVDSTARACEEVATSSESGSIAIASRSAGALYELNLVASDVEDHSGAGTRFYAVGRSYFPPSGNDKTLLVLIPKRRDTGVLVRSLSAFSSRHLDLVSIHSRPLRSAIGSYCFIITVEGHLGNRNIQEALQELLALGTTIKFLGSFSAWRGMLPEAPFESIKGATDISSGVQNWLSGMCVDGAFL